ncbi:hypothetical protein BSR29_02215 [Boudabousia liubingyangii]|uniref:ABC transporter domain-containing protein n=1 Tax=Boudabousia liubingyangii TaxID=1921764 RepID=A0A1Q5PQD1_9ACTO|nr:ABC transporter ATP-binding protein [Boudabousia liubingyangii]OKL48187.1 hypothetical protein BSR28_00270 [Boudabousia liubingyangii]OKL49784.1 hypothetical protein BSR29_02215 [Boudabousia liubingyangii]
MTETGLGNVNEPILQISDLSFAYGDRQVLADIALSLDSGQCLALVGPSGCGKSTLLKLLAGLLPLQSGRVSWDGKSDSAHAITAQVGALMPQSDALYPWLRVLDNVALGARLAGASKRDARAKALELLTQVGLADFTQAWPGELSGGMRSRVSFVRTLSSGRPLWLLDEPFGALDALTREEVQDWLLQQRQQHGATMVIVTHDVAEAVLLGDRIAVLPKEPGALVAELEVPQLTRADADFVTWCEQVRALLKA